MKAINSYLESLKQNLRPLPQEEQQNVVEFYHEFLLDGHWQTEREIVAKLGTPKKLAHKILAEYSTDDLTNTPSDKSQVTRRNIQSIWLILLGVFAAPIGIPFAIFLVLMMALVIATFLVLFIGLALAISGLFAGGLFILVRTAGLLFTQYWATGLTYVGLSLLAMTVALMFFPLLVQFIHFLIAQCAAFFRTIGKKIFHRQNYKVEVQ